MTTQNFLSEADQYLKNRKQQLEKSLAILQSLSGGSDSVKSLFKNNILQKIKDIVDLFGSYEDSSELFDSYVDEKTDEILNGSSLDEDGQRLNRSVLSTLGSIFATETSAPHYLAKKTADILYSQLEDRTSILDDISLYLGKCKDEISLLDSNWYSNYLVDTTNALNDVRNAIENMLTVRSYLYNKSAINDSQIELVKNNAVSAISNLSKIDSPASVINITYYIKRLLELHEDLSNLDETVVTYLSNLKNFKTNFNTAESTGNRFIDYVKEVTEYQYDDLVGIRESMVEVLNRRDARLALKQAPDWIKRLSLIGAISDEEVADFGEIINDSSNENTIKLETLMSNLSADDRQINTDIRDNLYSTIGLISQVVNIQIDQTSVINNIDALIIEIEEDSTATRTVMVDLSDYEPNPVEALDEFVRFIDTLDMDRLKTAITSSDWYKIFSMFENGLTHSEAISFAVIPFIDNIEDDELRNSILSLVYKIQAERQLNRIKSITFDTAKEFAINSLRTGKIRDVEIMVGQLQSINKRLESL